MSNLTITDAINHGRDVLNLLCDGLHEQHITRHDIDQFPGFDRATSVAVVTFIEAPASQNGVIINVQMGHNWHVIRLKYSQFVALQPSDIDKLINVAIHHRGEYVKWQQQVANATSAIESILIPEFTPTELA